MSCIFFSIGTDRVNFNCCLGLSCSLFCVGQAGKGRSPYNRSFSNTQKKADHLIIDHYKSMSKRKKRRLSGMGLSDHEAHSKSAMAVQGVCFREVDPDANTYDNLKIVNDNLLAVLRAVSSLNASFIGARAVKDEGEICREEIRDYVGGQLLESPKAVNSLASCNRAAVRDVLWLQLGNDSKAGGPWKTYLNRRLHNRISRTLPFVIVFLYQAGGE